MADLPQQITIKQYLADGLTLIYPYTFLVPLPGDVQVYITLNGQEPNPAADIKQLTVDYTVQNTGNISGGTITFVVAPPNGAVVTFSRDVAASIDTNFANAANFNGQNLDNAFERVTLVAQQNQTYALQRNLSYKVNAYLPPADLEANTQLPVLGDNEIWIGSGGGVINAPLEQGGDVAILRAQLLNAQPVTNGAGIVGYYDVVNSVSTTVKAFLDNLSSFIGVLTTTFKSGMMIDFGGSSVPSGWLICNGAAVSRVTYADLFTAIGTTWGVGDGSTTFNLPNLARRVTLGVGGTATSTAFTGTTLGSTGGEEVHVQTEAELATHTHLFSYLTLPSGGSDIAGGPGFTETITPTPTSGVGASLAMNNMQLGAVVNKIIKI